MYPGLTKKENTKIEKLIKEKEKDYLFKCIKYCFKVCVHYIFASLFLSLNEIPCQIRKHVFNFTSKALLVLTKFKF